MHIHHSALLITTTLIIFLLFFSGCTKDAVGPAGPQGPPGQTGGDDLTNPNVFPAVIFTNPANASVGPFGLYNNENGFGRPHFILRFNKLMATFSVGERTVRCSGFDRPVVVLLHYDYDVPTGPESGHSSELFNNFLGFTVHDSASVYTRIPYRVGRVVTVTVDTSIEDINGHHLAQPFTFSFLPEPYFRVLRISPEDGTMDVSQSAYFSVNFNSKVGADILTSLHVIPGTTGRWTIQESDSDAATFRSAQSLPFGSFVTLTVDNAARDKYANMLTQPYRSSFTITQYRVAYTAPANNETEVSPSTGIRIALTGLNDTSTIRQAFSIIPALPGTITTFEQSFEFRASNEMMPGTRYTATLSTALTARDGTHLSAPHSFSFTTAAFRVRNFYPEYGATSVSRSGWMYIYCTASVDTGSVRNAFSISPPANMTFVFSGNSTTISFFPTTPLDANRFYTVTLSTALRSKSGATLQTPFTTVFTTGL